MSLRGVCRVLYAPNKVFREIAQNPRYTGPVLVLVLFIFINFGLSYISLCKIYLDQVLPENDEWTEETLYWNSTTATVKVNPADFIHANFYYGNKSIEFQAKTTNNVQIKLNFTRNVNCFSTNGYKNLTFSMKIVEPSEILPYSVILYLDSKLGSFYRSVTNVIITTRWWNNVTLSLGDHWLSLGNPVWDHVTGLRFELAWPSVQENITFRVDGIFFHGVYKSRIEESNYLLIDLFNPYSPANALMQFFLQWAFLSGLLYIFPRFFGVKTVWKPVFATSGYILIIYVVRILIFAMIYVVSPNLYFPLECLSGLSEGCETFLVFDPYYKALWVIDKIILVWAIFLCTIMVHVIFKLPWDLSIFTSVSAFVVYLILLLLFTPAPPILI